LHRLAGTDGRTEPLHGHNWAVTAEVAAPELDDAGVVMDFGRLSAALDEVLAGLENTELDRIEYFRRRGSSAEALAMYVYEGISLRVAKNASLRSVRVVEGDGCEAAFMKD
jgi:6-pyruvoyltetrahydropterin/6-carboxytetrahydropterin synthase